LSSSKIFHFFSESIQQLTETPPKFCTHPFYSSGESKGLSRNDDRRSYRRHLKARPDRSPHRSRKSFVRPEEEEEYAQTLIKLMDELTPENSVEQAFGLIEDLNVALPA
jgi:hypothetical protein